MSTHERARRLAARHRREDDLRARVDELRSAVCELVADGHGVDDLRDGDLLDLARRAEPHDSGLHGHLARLGGYTSLLGRALGWDAERCELLRRASLLHDLGKVGIPVEIRTKDGLFTAEDRAVMETHAAIGHGLLSGTGSVLLDLAALIARNHHERVDGSGYPGGLRGRDIPVEARIVAIADVFDALTSERRYKRAMTVSQARALMITSRGTGFDPELLDAFIDHLDEVVAIRQRPVERALPVTEP